MRLCRPHSKAMRMAVRFWSGKRQRATALHDAGALPEPPRKAARFWSAVVLYSFPSFLIIENN